MASTDPNAEKQEPKVEQQQDASNVNMPNGMSLTVEELYDKDKFDLSTMEPGDVFQLLQYVYYSAVCSLLLFFLYYTTLLHFTLYFPPPLLLSKYIRTRKIPYPYLLIFPAILFPFTLLHILFLNYNQNLFPLCAIPLIFCSFFFHVSLTPKETICLLTDTAFLLEPLPKV